MKPAARLGLLVAPPAAGFEQPFEMLEACHERVQRTLRLLARLRAHVARHGADAQAQQAARDVMRYFDLAAPQHHQDEELHVFPPLLAHGGPDVRALVARLQQDHLRMAAQWQAARAVLARIEAAQIQALTAEEAAPLDAFAHTYDGHIEAEEALAYPAAAALLDERAREAMGAEMALRRGADRPPS
ncbi:hemerythrin-like domain-containing protein [Variovorax sp. TBS-050B]|uniref:hemerythrin domain-containing protein n=1 Tax=Variovorax sp. TBS-050B TaxID=2940551 RepID=UPI002474EE94|nr:hemerythrin domain-containing protein [Variovorax sp. TBS-050B]MDH6590596.1 hemerythrin-like domain-containing protein [Variovorax sp. TBS-050B]